MREFDSPNEFNIPTEYTLHAEPATDMGSEFNERGAAKEGEAKRLSRIRQLKSLSFVTSAFAAVYLLYPMYGMDLFPDSGVTAAVVASSSAESSGADESTSENKAGASTSVSEGAASTAEVSAAEDNSSAEESEAEPTPSGEELEVQYIDIVGPWVYTHPEENPEWLDKAEQWNFRLCFKHPTKIDLTGVSFDGIDNGFGQAVVWLSEQGVDVSGLHELESASTIRSTRKASSDALFVGDPDDMDNIYMLQGSYVDEIEYHQVWLTFDENK